MNRRPREARGPIKGGRSPRFVLLSHRLRAVSLRQMTALLRIRMRSWSSCSSTQNPLNEGPRPKHEQIQKRQVDGEGEPTSGACTAHSDQSAFWREACFQWIEQRSTSCYHVVAGFQWVLGEAVRWKRLIGLRNTCCRHVDGCGYGRSAIIERKREADERVLKYLFCSVLSTPYYESIGVPAVARHAG